MTECLKTISHKLYGAVTREVELLQTNFHSSFHLDRYRARRRSMAFILCTIQYIEMYADAEEIYAFQVLILFFFFIKCKRLMRGEH